MKNNTTDACMALFGLNSGSPLFDQFLTDTQASVDTDFRKQNNTKRGSVSKKSRGRWIISYTADALPEDKEEVRELLHAYAQIAKTAPAGYQPDYYVLLAGYPVIITQDNNG